MTDDEKTAKALGAYQKLRAQMEAEWSEERVKALVPLMKSRIAAEKELRESLGADPTKVENFGDWIKSTVDKYNAWVLAHNALKDAGFDEWDKLTDQLDQLRLEAIHCFQDSLVTPKHLSCLSIYA